MQTWFSIKEFFRFLKRVYDYLPILWQDRDYDYVFILSMLKYKIERTRKHIIKCNSLVEEDLREITEAALDIEALIEDHSENNGFYDFAYENLLKKWGEIVFVEVETPVGPGTTVTRSNVKTEEDRIQCDKDFQDLFAQEQERREADWNLLFDLLKRDLRKFWD